MSSRPMLIQLESVIPELGLGNPCVLLFTTFITPTLTSFLQDDFNFELCLRLLSNLPEQLKLQSIKDKETRIRTLAGRLLTRLILNYIQYKLVKGRSFEPFEEIAFTYNRFGKPSFQIEKNFPLQFNSSNSNNAFSLVVEISKENSPVGIDLSHSRQHISSVDFMDQFQPIFHKLESKQLYEIADLKRRYFVFNQLWTLKEAFTKFLGSGLNIELADFHFTLDPAFNESGDKIAHDSSTKISKSELKWSKSEINVAALAEKKNSFLLQLSNRNDFYCRSAVLKPRDKDELPVVISFITQTKDPNIGSFAVNLESILKEFIA